jgi:hypothetical protein
MSKRNASIRAHENNTVAYDIEHRSAYELQTLYGIQFVEDPDEKTGLVFDPVSDKVYQSISEWSAVMAQDSEWSNMGSEYEDEYGQLDDY